MIPFLYIQTELADRYNLDLTQTAVLFMPSVATVKRALCSLIKKNLLNVQNDRITAQIERPNAQNERPNAQNDRITAQNERPNAQNDRQTINNNINNNNIFSSNAQGAAEKEKEIDFKLNSSRKRD